MNTFTKFLGVIRAPFLLLVPVCILPALAVAFNTGENLFSVKAGLILLAGLCAHIAVNAFNEYHDFRSGLDAMTQRTPFSGGSGTLGQEANFLRATLLIAVLSTLILMGIGVFFMLEVGVAIAPFGLLGIAIILSYTPWINRFPLLCLLAPGVGFGLLMSNLAAQVLLGEVPASVGVVSVLIFALVNHLLLVNQFPDIEPDRQVGRNHIAIASGLASAKVASAALLMLAYFSIAIGVFSGLLPTLSLIGFSTIPLARKVAAGVRDFSDKAPLEEFIPAMGANVAVTLLTPSLVAVGMFVDKLLAE